jgi:hypothetical protein
MHFALQSTNLFFHIIYNNLLKKWQCFISTRTFLREEERSAVNIASKYKVVLIQKKHFSKQELV